jgi:hypothetical protein
MKKDYYLQIVTEVKPNGYRLWVKFSDGFEAEIDMKPWIESEGRQSAMADAALFAQVKVTDLGAPEWPGEIDLSPGSLRAWCEAGRVMSLEETDEWTERYGEPIEGVA